MVYDVLIIGGGTSGLTAAIYLLRAGKKVLVLEKGAFGGQIAFSPKVENYPGLPTMSGSDFADRLLSQVMEMGGEVDVAEIVELLDCDGIKEAKDSDGQSYRGRAVVLATGARHRRLGIEGEGEIEGICYCAVCDGDFYRDRNIAVVGGGNSALQEALFLSEICQQVTLVQNLPYLTGEGSLQKKVAEKSNIKVVVGRVVKEFIHANEVLCGVRICAEDGSNTQDLQLDGLFVSIGLEPQNECFQGLADLDEQGYFLSDENCMTKTPGVFVAGDCRQKQVRQLTTAAGDGSVAAVVAARYLNECL